MPEPISEQYAAMQRQPWKEIVPRLMDYALKKARRRHWQGILNGWMPGGHEAEDIAMQAIEKVLSGRRRWDPQKEPDILKVLTSIVDSLVSHLAQGWENKRVRSESALSAHAAVDGEDAHLIDRHADPLDSPSALAMQHEREKESHTFVSELRDFVRTEPDLLKAVDCIVDGAAKRADLAASLGLTARQMTNLRKKLQVRLRHFLGQRNKKRPFSKGEPADA